MKKIKVLLTIVCLSLLGVSTAFAQGFQGEATYQSVTQMKNFSFKGEGMTPEMENQIMEKMKKQMQKEYTLKFNLNESVWKEVESLEGGPATAASGGVMVTVSTSAAGILYKNTSELKYLREAEVFSKPFLVDDELEAREWVLTEESKKIGNYTAYKATYTNIFERRTMSFGNDEENEMKTVMDTTEIEAWYTPEIPVSQGPVDYWGLPGLILEVVDGNTTYLCTKVSLNPAEGIEIKKPSKGKKVNREELRAITDEKTKEMMEKFNNKGGGERMQFRIGGGN